MTLKRAVYTSTLAAGVGLAGLFGAGLGTASADPGQQPCNAPGAPACGQDQHRNDNGDRGNSNQGRDDNRGPAQADWQGRGVDQGRQDHQPFNWNGSQVTPLPAGNGAGWGFWFGPVWIPL